MSNCFALASAKFGTECIALLTKLQIFYHCKYKQLTGIKAGVRGQSLVHATINVRKYVRDSACHVIERSVQGRVYTEFKNREKRVRF